MAVNAAANRALAPEASKLLQLEMQVIHIDLGCYESAPTQNGCDNFIPTQNSPQSMRVWPGLRLIGAGGKIPKGVFVAVAEVEPDGVRLDNGMRLKNQELLRAKPRSDLRQLHPPQPRPPGPGVLPPHAAPPTWAPHGPRAPSCWRRPRTGSTAFTGAPLHKLRGARHRLPAGSQKRQRSKSILHFTRLPLALTLTARCSWLSSSRPPERASGRPAPPPPSTAPGWC